tara:strand:- start:1637 stop:1894 length:258 start_codon:yes stop_codon:yes gene_type:complete
MKNDKLLKTLTNIFHSVFKNQNINLNINSNPENTVGWDSLNHILFLIEIEKYYSIKFTAGEVLSNKNIGQICDSINSKLNKKIIT